MMITWNSCDGYSNANVSLISAGATLDVKTPDGVTPLYLASKEGDNDVVLSLVKAGADINSLNGRNSLTPLMIAIIEGQDQVANLLLKVRCTFDICTFFGLEFS